MPNPNTITYEAASGKVWTFSFPTVTETQVVVPSALGFARMSTRHVYTVRSVLVASDANDLVTQREGAKEILEFVGGVFTWTRDTDDIIAWGPTDDVSFGPHPTSLTFEKFYGVCACWIVWQIEVEVAAIDSEVLDLVYSVSHIVDHNFYTTRTIAGMLRMNGAKFDPNTFKGADQFRGTIENYVCGCPDGWKRVGFQSDMGADGLTLTFNIVDTQRLAVLPPNVSDGDANLSIQGNPLLGNKKDFRLVGWYESPTDQPLAPQNAFVSLASSLFNFSIVDETFRVKWLSLNKNLYRNRLEFEMVWDAFEPRTDPSPIPGDTPTERTANWMLLLLTRSDDWIQQFKGGVSTNRGLYGTTQVHGFCGSGTVAPVVTPTDYQVARDAGGSSGNSSTSGSSSDQSIQASDTVYYYEYHQTFSYHTDYGVVVTPYKDITKADALEQVRAVVTYVSVKGRICTNGSPANTPAPPFLPTEAVLLDRKQSNPEPLSGPEYCTEWSYLLKIKKVPDQTTPDPLRIPYSPFVDHTIFTGRIDPDSDDPQDTYLPVNDIEYVNDLTPPDTLTSGSS